VELREGEAKAEREGFRRPFLDFALRIRSNTGHCRGEARWGPAFLAFIFTAALVSTEVAVFVGQKSAKKLGLTIGGRRSARLSRGRRCATFTVLRRHLRRKAMQRPVAHRRAALGISVAWFYGVNNDAA
jgi:hypothetical protein